MSNLKGVVNAPTSIDRIIVLWRHIGGTIERKALPGKKVIYFQRNWDDVSRKNDFIFCATLAILYLPT